jgi:hypothetical protein
MDYRKQRSRRCPPSKGLGSSRHPSPGPASAGAPPSSIQTIRSIGAPARRAAKSGAPQQPFARGPGHRLAAGGVRCGRIAAAGQRGRAEMAGDRTRQVVQRGVAPQSPPGARLSRGFRVRAVHNHQRRLRRSSQCSREWGQRVERGIKWRRYSLAAVDAGVQSCRYVVVVSPCAEQQRIKSAQSSN